jgi:hypothetical protein
MSMQKGIEGVLKIEQSNGGLPAPMSVKMTEDRRRKHTHFRSPVLRLFSKLEQ